MGTRLIYSTFPEMEAAEAAAREMVEAGLVACANILPAMVSLYRWEGALERAQEVVLLLKTTQARAPEVMEALKARHPYEMPAILVLEVADGDPAYLGWIADECFRKG